jgi:enoyl-CoA hydratase
MGSSNAIVTEIDQAVAIIRFNNPVKRNPISTETLHELKDTFSALVARDDIEAIIFTGTDDVFASGANLRELSQLTSESAPGFAQLGQQVFEAIANASQLTIAAINGYCMGGAVDLALACDIRVAAPHALFAHPGVRLGIITGWGGTQRLPRLIGKGAAIELFLTGRRFSADEALALGLVSMVSPEPLRAALSIARAAIK